MGQKRVQEKEVAAREERNATRKIFHTTFGLAKEQEQRENGQRRNGRVAIQKR